MNTEKEPDRRLDQNPDPITGAPGAHPVGTGVGAAGGALAGAAVGAVGGPIGIAVGGAIGAVVGGLAGKGVAEQIEPTAENAYWEEQHRYEPYYDPEYSYDDYAPAYRAGWESYESERTFEEEEPYLRDKWEAERGESTLPWDKAKHAARSGWERIDRSL